MPAEPINVAAPRSASSACADLADSEFISVDEEMAKLMAFFKNRTSQDTKPSPIQPIQVRFTAPLPPPLRFKTRHTRAITSAPRGPKSAANSVAVFGAECFASAQSQSEDCDAAEQGASSTQYQVNLTSEYDRLLMMLMDTEN